MSTQPLKNHYSVSRSDGSGYQSPACAPSRASAFGNGGIVLVTMWEQVTCAACLRQRPKIEAAARALDTAGAESAEESIRAALTETRARNRIEALRAAQPETIPAAEEPISLRASAGAPVLALRHMREPEPEPSGFDSPRARAAAETLIARQRAAEDRYFDAVNAGAPAEEREALALARNTLTQPESAPAPAQSASQDIPEEPQPERSARPASAFPFKTAILAGAGALVFIAALFAPAEPDASAGACAPVTSAPAIERSR